VIASASTILGVSHAVNRHFFRRVFPLDGVTAKVRHGRRSVMAVLVENGRIGSGGGGRRSSDGRGGSATAEATADGGVTA